MREYVVYLLLDVMFIILLSSESLKSVLFEIELEGLAPDAIVGNDVMQPKELDYCDNER